MTAEPEIARSYRMKAEYLRAEAAQTADEIARASLIAAALHWDRLADRLEPPSTI